tara:strand:- start:183 stop:752 length:570 start_codon:yes stop_codon:yes gene_type:complete
MEGYASKPIIFLMITLIGFFQFLLMLRFIFELMRVSYNNQITQLVVKTTDPILVPLRLIPLYIGRIDLIIILLITLVTTLKIYINPNFSGFEYSLTALLVAGFGYAIKETIDILWYAVIIGAIGSWFMSYNAHPIFQLIDEICEPMYKPVRSIMPNLSGIDLSPIILLVGLNLLQMIILPPIFNITRYL